MFNNVSFKKEIETKLHDVPRDKCLVFAVRSALRVLPLLTFQQKEAFGFWTEDCKNQHLLSLLMACNYGLEYALTKKCVSEYSLAACAAAECAAKAASTNTIASSVAQAATATAYAAAADISAIAISSVVAVAEASAMAVIAASVDSIIEDMRQDLHLLENITAKALLRQPLCLKTNSKQWRQLIANFKTDALSLNAGFEIWLDWYDDRLNSSFINIELMRQWNNVQEKFQQQDAAAVNAYLKKLQQKITTQPLNRVRAIFIGANGAGKTSLIRALHGESVVETNNKNSTAGIDIRDWFIPNTDITAHLWDFDDQVIAQASYQFFLRPDCLYVLVLNADDEQAEYWLKQLQNHAENASVMIVGNKIDQARVNLNMAYLKNKYPNIVDFYPVSCTEAHTHFKAEFSRFERDFCQYLQQVGIHKKIFTTEQLDVLDTLDYYASQMDFLSQHEFMIVCTNKGINIANTRNKDWLLDILDKIGVIIYFPQLNYLEKFLLNPRWLTYGVYTLINNKCNPLSLEEAQEVLHDNLIRDENAHTLNYLSSECNFIINMMQDFKLCYSLPDKRNVFIIPELLPINPLDCIPFEKTDALKFEIEFYEFLPRYLMPELIANFYREIANNMVWQEGVLLRYHLYQAYALLEVDYQRDVLVIWIKGIDAKDYFNFLNYEILEILGQLELDYKEWFVLPLSACIKEDKELITHVEKVPYQQIRAFLKKKNWRYLSESGLEYDLKRILSPNAQEDMRLLHNEIKIFQDGLASFLLSTLFMVYILLFFKNEIELIKSLKDTVYFIVSGVGVYFFIYKLCLFFMKLIK